MQMSNGLIMNGAPHADAMLVNAIVLNWKIAEDGGIDTWRRTAFFLGHTAVETGGFRTLTENLYYTTVGAVRKAWPSRFKSDAAAEKVLRNPELLGNTVYGSRMGNEDNGTNDNDGFDNRGSGMIMTTGADNMREFAKETGIKDFRPEMLRQMPDALSAAVVFWNKRGLNKFADAGDIEGSTKAIQGGTGGLAERRVMINRYLSILQPAGSGVTKRNDKGGDVVELQNGLTALGFYGGKIDADFGPGTERAVLDFQKEFGLFPDGVAGPMTWAYLNQKLKEQKE